MNRKIKKGPLILIILLLILTSCLAIWGYIANAKGVNIVEPENTNHEFKFNGKLYFYDNDKLLATYKCSDEKCDYANYSIDDNKYILNYHKDGSIEIDEQIQEVEENTNPNYINNRYVFIQDGSIIVLLDLSNSKVIYKLNNIKNYGIGIENDYYIVSDTNSKWGVLSLKDNAAYVINPEYDFIGLTNKINEETNKINSDLFVVKNSEGWKLINSNNVKQSSDFINPIYDYNNKYVITAKNDIYYLNDLTGGDAMKYGYKKIDIYGKYVGIINNEDEFYIMDPETNEEISEKYDIDEEDDFRATLSGNSIFIFINNKFINKIEID